MTNRVLAATMTLLSTISMASAEVPPESATWNADRTAAVAVEHTSRGSLVLAYVLQADGSFREIDLSAVENRNLGKLGRDRNDYDHLVTTPVGWLPRQDGLLQVRIQTQAWKQGKHFTAEEPLVFSPAGEVLWR